MYRYAVMYQGITLVARLLDNPGFGVARDEDLPGVRVVGFFDPSDNMTFFPFFWADDDRPFPFGANVEPD